MGPGASVPRFLQAAWKRLYDLQDGKPDFSVDVRNVQTPTLFGDVRIPKDRPPFPPANSLRDYSDEKLLELGFVEQEGFSGFASVDGLISTWRHQIHWNPLDGSADVGMINLEGGRNMIETGVLEVYTEHWWRLDSGKGYTGDDQFLGVEVLRKLPNGTQRLWEILSVAGDHFIYARNRPEEIPMAPSMRKLIETTKPNREQLINYLDVEVSHGFLQSGRCPWEIQFSTMPFRQGESLAFARQIQVDAKTGLLSPRGDHPDQIWSFPVNTLGVEDLLVLFPPDPPKA